MKAHILTYHSQNIAGDATSNNDHVALGADLAALDSAGCRIVPLHDLVMALYEGAPLDRDRPLVCLTFDDGCDYDVRSLEYPGYGIQTAFLEIMSAFLAEYGTKRQPGLHATSFVIASSEARRLIDQRSLFAAGHMSDDWWRDAVRHPLFEVGNHGWDHNHPDLPETDHPRGGFAVIDTLDTCRRQVLRSAEYIEAQSGRWPRYFAYPYGESSDYLRNHYFPEFLEEHRCLAALGTEPQPASASSDRWNLPRYVCGRDWSDPDGLLGIINP